MLLCKEHGRQERTISKDPRELPKHQRRFAVDQSFKEDAFSTSFVLIFEGVVAVVLSIVISMEEHIVTCPNNE